MIELYFILSLVLCWFFSFFTSLRRFSSKRPWEITTTTTNRWLFILRTRTKCNGGQLMWFACSLFFRRSFMAGLFEQISGSENLSFLFTAIWLFKLWTKSRNIVFVRLVRWSEMLTVLGREWKLFAELASSLSAFVCLLLLLALRRPFRLLSMMTNQRHSAIGLVFNLFVEAPTQFHSSNNRQTMSH